MTPCTLVPTGEYRAKVAVDRALQRAEKKRRRPRGMVER